MREWILSNPALLLGYVEDSPKQSEFTIYRRDGPLNAPNRLSVPARAIKITVSIGYGPQSTVFKVCTQDAEPSERGSVRERKPDTFCPST